MAILFSVLSAFQYGVADFSGGFATRRNRVATVVVLSQIAGLFVGAIVAPIVSPGFPSSRDLLWGAAAGLAGAAGLVLLYTALAETVVAIASPTAALTGALVPALFGVITGESVSGIAWVGAALIIPAILALTVQPGQIERAGRAAALRALATGIEAGIGFGLFFVLISRVSNDGGLWPLISARIASILVLLPMAIGAGRLGDRSRQSFLALLVAGVFDMGANICLLLALQSGTIVLVTLVTSMYPAPTVLLARMIYRERISLLRWAGLALAIAGVALMGLG